MTYFFLAIAFGGLVLHSFRRWLRGRRIIEYVVGKGDMVMTVRVRERDLNKPICKEHIIEVLQCPPERSAK